MKKFVLTAVCVILLGGAIALSSNQPKGPALGLQIAVEGRNPWTNLNLNDAGDLFHFVVVSDRTGGHRARVFSMAVDQINLLQPTFVVSVGDLIEGYTKEPAKLAEEWREFQGFVGKLTMPFFYVPGNHDLANLIQEKEYKERFGRSYYHFVYKDVLFLAVNSSDPAEDKGEVMLSPEQIEYFQKVLKENAGVRWTVVLVHKPMWVYDNLEKNGWLEIEKGLQGRNYTVFAGHVHRYEKFVRHGMNYYQLATTGGGSRMRGLRYGEFDHISWVTMKRNGPVIANIMLDGIYPENLDRRYTDEEGYVYKNMKPTLPQRGTVLLDGGAVPDGQVIFFLAADKEGKKFTRVADALTEGDGGFSLTTYKANDGIPAGDYIITVSTRGKNRLPEIYARPGTSPLRFTAKAGGGPALLEMQSKQP